MNDADAGRTFPVLPTPDDVRRVIAMEPTTDRQLVTRAAFELLLCYETYREELCSEASVMPEEKIARDPETGEVMQGATVQSGHLDELWNRVEAARTKLVVTLNPPAGGGPAEVQ